MGIVLVQAGSHLGAGEPWYGQEGLGEGSDWLPEATLDAFPGVPSTRQLSLVLLYTKGAAQL